MAQTSSTLAMIPTALLSLAVLASCGQDGGGGDAAAPGSSQASPAAQLFPDDFKGVCSGATVARSTAYDPAAKVHKVVYFETFKDDYTDSSTTIPADWTVQFTPDSDAYAAVDLVACAKRTAVKEVKVCDGYEKDDKPTQNTVRWHTATYELSVYESKSGKMLGQTTLEANSTDCPMFQTFNGNADTVDGYASPVDSAVTEFLKQYVAP